MNSDVQGAREIYDYIRASDPDEGFGLFAQCVAAAVDQARGNQFLRDVQTLCPHCARQETVMPDEFGLVWYHGNQPCLASALHTRMAEDLIAQLEASDAS